MGRKIFVGALLFFLTVIVLVFACVRKDNNSEQAKGPAEDEKTLIFKNGEAAPNIPLPDFYKVEIGLDKFKGKLILLNFWATFCPPCLAEMPALQHLYLKYKSRGLEVIGVNLDPPETIKDVVGYVKDNRISYTILMDTDLKASKAYGVTGLPETFFIDPNGKFISIVDPVWAGDSVRLTSDYPWDAPVYTKLVEDLLDRYFPASSVTSVNGK